MAFNFLNWCNATQTHCSSAIEIRRKHMSSSRFIAINNELRLIPENPLSDKKAASAAAAAIKARNSEKSIILSISGSFVLSAIVIPRKTWQGKSHTRALFSFSLATLILTEIRADYFFLTSRDFRPLTMRRRRSRVPSCSRNNKINIERDRDASGIL